jgi:4-hydroxy-tetrahydrodipicolinate reductase
MKISIVGYGAMGQLVEQCALERKIEIGSIIDPFQTAATHKSFSEESMAGIDVCVCFSQPDVAMENIKDICQWKKQAVIATTGWTDQMADVEKRVGDAGIGMVYSSNFSLGVNIFFKIIEKTSQIFDKFDVYDVFGYEAHHNRKMDSPSGTAVTLSNIILDNISRKEKVCEEKLDRKIEPNEFHFASMRGGNVPGTHAVLFDSDFDTIELKHTARNRLGFANGSILAAQWILDKKGMFTEADMMNQLMP